MGDLESIIAIVVALNVIVRFFFNHVRAASIHRWTPMNENPSSATEPTQKPL